MAERSLAQIDLRARRPSYFPSPAAWEDEVLYFLMLDRFSDGREQEFLANDGTPATGGTTPRFRPTDAGSADRETWVRAGQRFCGGTLNGLATKIGYLARLGITAIWISPIFKQLRSRETYHGYGIQDFLDVDPRFGTRDDLVRLVDTAHAHGVRVILDIILNHTGDVFAYDADRYETTRGGSTFMDPRWDGRAYRAAGFRDADGSPTLPLARLDAGTHPHAFPDGAVWPIELQDPDTFTRRGRIDNWDHDPEFLEGDFFDLKNVQLGAGPIDHYRPSPALRALAQVYQFWIGLADIDGYRVDTVKHMDLGASRYFASVIHEYAQAVGKENFALIGEITGGRSRAFQTLELTGLDAALGVDDIPDKLEFLVKGWRAPEEYFSLFRNSLLVQKESHTWFRNKVVTMVDDHDQVRKGGDKARFCAGGVPPALAIAVLGLNATTLGIPCLYYGSEQGFDGNGPSDQFLRETMFGGDYGAFRSTNRHCFDETGAIYRGIAALLAVRRQFLALRRGRQYLREISGNGIDFGPPRPIGARLRSLVPWSRLFDDVEVVCALNTDTEESCGAWVTIDDGLHRAGDTLRCVYSSPPGGVGTLVPIEARNGKAVRLQVPAAGFVIYASR